MKLKRNFCIFSVIYWGLEGGFKDEHTFTDFYITVINGLIIQVCDGADIDKLNQVILNESKHRPIFGVDVN
ncbi:hypothetical protein [Providencia vermicola]|uniref:hypothetical protein n=1 Tax=Providencia vermicola TaxID=333965 RepID=UPI0034DD39F9